MGGRVVNLQINKYSSLIVLHLWLCNLILKTKKKQSQVKVWSSIINPPLHKKTIKREVSGCAHKLIFCQYRDLSWITVPPTYTADLTPIITPTWIYYRIILGPIIYEVFCHFHWKKTKTKSLLKTRNLCTCSKPCTDFTFRYFINVRCLWVKFLFFRDFYFLLTPPPVILRIVRLWQKSSTFLLCYNKISKKNKSLSRSLKK